MSTSTKIGYVLKFLLVGYMGHISLLLPILFKTIWAIPISFILLCISTRAAWLGIVCCMMEDTPAIEEKEKWKPDDYDYRRATSWKTKDDVIIVYYPDTEEYYIGKENEKNSGKYTYTKLAFYANAFEEYMKDKNRLELSGLDNLVYQVDRSMKIEHEMEHGTLYEGRINYTIVHGQFISFYSKDFEIQGYYDEEGFHQIKPGEIINGKFIYDETLDKIFKLGTYITTIDLVYYSKIDNLSNNHLSDRERYYNNRKFSLYNDSSGDKATFNTTNYAIDNALDKIDYRIINQTLNEISEYIENNITEYIDKNNFSKGV